MTTPEAKSNVMQEQEVDVWEGKVSELVDQAYSMVEMLDKAAGQIREQMWSLGSEDADLSESLYERERRLSDMVYRIKTAGQGGRP